MSLSLHSRWLEETTAETNGRMDLAASFVSNIFLFLLIFGLSATVNIRHLRKELSNKFALLTGVVMQFLFMPLLGFSSVMALRNYGLTQAMGITLLVVTSSPGGSYSNWWCSTFNADLALSVAMTAVSTILSIGLLPANLFLYSILVYGVTDQDGILQSLDLKAIFTSLAIVICAILSGLYASYKIDSTHFHKMANGLGSLSGICLILVSVFLSSGQDDTNFWSQHWTFYVGVALPCALGLALANCACRLFRLRKPEQMAISIECCYQNVGIATSVAVNMFEDPVERAQALSVPLFYGIVEAILICIYCIWSWKMGWTKAPKDEKLCVVVTRTYEIGHDDDDEDHDEETEEQPQQQVPEEELQLTGWRAWLAWPFVPRYPDHFVTSSQQDVEMALETPAKKPIEEERSRFVSEDYTAATSTTDGTTPPNTPGADSTFDDEEGMEDRKQEAIDVQPQPPLPEDVTVCIPR